MFKRQSPLIVLLSIAALSILVACAAPAQEEPTPQPTQEPPTAIPPTPVEPAPTATPEAPPPTPAKPAPTSPATTGYGPATGGASPIAGHSLRVVTFNTHLLSPMFQCGAPTPTNEHCFFLNPLGETTAFHAQLIANHLAAGYYDVVALNEVWDEDDGKETLIDTLKGVYPYRVEYVGWSGVDFEEDSGLMLFSMLPFEPLPDHTFKSEDNITHDENDSDRVAFVHFDACDDFDCWASKGAFLVRLRHPSERIINVVVTHLQADYGGTNYSSARYKQLKQIYLDPPNPTVSGQVQPTLIETTLGVPSLSYWPNEQWILIMGDLNVDGRGGVGEALFPAQAPNPQPSEWWFRFGAPAAVSNATLYDAWAETTSETDFGSTNGLNPGERLDYILASRRTSEPWKDMPPDMCVQHVWKPPEFESLSDHLAVAADLNLEAPQCNPRLAYEPTLEEMGVMTSAQEMEATMLNGQITHPGSMQWWRLGDLGTYSIAFDPNAAAAGVRYEVYDADDLSHPLGGSHWVEKNKILVCSSPSSADPENRSQAQRCWWAESETMVFSDDVYIRVFNDDRAWTGHYWIAFHQHACKTKEDACSLLPNSNLTSFDFPDGKLLNQKDGAWFRIDIREQADTGARQDLQFLVWSREDTWTEPDVLIFDQGGVDSLSKIDGEPHSGPMAFNLMGNQPAIVYTATTSLNEVLYMRVFRDDMNQPLPIKVGWATNLTLLGGVAVGPGDIMLICNDETNPEDGYDEIALQVDIDYTGWQDRGYDTFDCNDSSDERFWNILGDIRYLHQVQIRLIERDSGSDDDDVSGTVVQQAWPIDTVVSDPVRAEIPVEWEGGKYTIVYNVGKWVVH